MSWPPQSYSWAAAAAAVPLRPTPRATRGTRPPPRALTSDTAAQARSLLRGDRVAYVDYGDDPYDPGGCPGNAQARFTIATTSVAHGGRGVAVTDGLPMSPSWLSADRVYVLHQDGLGFAPLP